MAHRYRINTNNPAGGWMFRVTQTASAQFIVQICRNTHPTHGEDIYTLSWRRPLQKSHPAVAARQHCATTPSISASRQHSHIFDTFNILFRCNPLVAQFSTHTVSVENQWSCRRLAEGLEPATLFLRSLELFFASVVVPQSKSFILRLF